MLLCNLCFLFCSLVSNHGAEKFLSALVHFCFLTICTTASSGRVVIHARLCKECNKVQLVTAWFVKNEAFSISVISIFGV